VEGDAETSVEKPAPAAKAPAAKAPAAKEEEGYEAEAADAAPAADKSKCEDAELRSIIEKAVNAEKDNLEAARKIEKDAAAKFGGRFNSIVSDSEFAYVNWYGKRNCQIRVGSRHTLTWED